MKHSRVILLVAVLGSGCFGGAVELEPFDVVLDPATVGLSQEVRDALPEELQDAALSELSEELGDTELSTELEFPISVIIPTKVSKKFRITETVIHAIVIRTVSAGDYDEKKEFRKEYVRNEKSFECQPGQPTLDFIKSIDVHIVLPSKKKILLANFDRDSEEGAEMVSPCAVSLTVENYNLVQFLPDFDIILTPRGTIPETELQLTGLVTASAKAEATLK